MPKEKRVKLRQPKEIGCTDSLSLFYIFTKVAKALYRSRSLTLSGQILNNLTCNDQSCHRGYEREASGNVPAFCALVLCAGRADAVGAAADGHIFNRPGGRLFRIYHL